MPERKEQKKQVFSRTGRIVIPILILVAVCFAYRTSLANHLYSFVTGKSLMARLPDCGDGPVVIVVPFISFSSPPLLIVVADETVKRTLIEAARESVFVKGHENWTNHHLSYTGKDGSLRSIQITSQFLYEKADYENPRLQEALAALKNALVRQYGEQPLAELRPNAKLVVIGGDKGEEIRLSLGNGAAEIVTTSALDYDSPYAKHLKRKW